MERKVLTINDFIKQFFIKEIKQIAFGDDENKTSHPYLASALMAIGIEFLGKCIRLKNINQTELYQLFEQNHSTNDFNLALQELQSLQKYNNISLPNGNLYKVLRCGFCHTMLPKSNLILMEGNGNYSVNDGELTLYLESFYNDFERACNELINLHFLMGENNLLSTTNTSSSLTINQN